MADPRTAKHLDKAADVMSRKGRAIGRLQDDDGGVCVLGALGTAAYNDPWRMDGDVRRAAEAMKESGVTKGREVWQFNDGTRDDRKVIRAMRDAAQVERMKAAEECLTDEMRVFWATPGEDVPEKELVQVKQRAANNPLGVSTGPGW